MSLIAAIEDPAVSGKILECLKLTARSLPIEPASWAAIPPEPVAPDVWFAAHLNAVYEEGRGHGIGGD